MIYLRRLTEHKFAVFLIIATIVGIIFIAVYGASKRSASTIERIGGDAASAPQGVISSIGNFFGGITDYFGSNKQLKEENAKLKSENDMLQKQINENKGMQSENDELRQMLDLKKSQTDLTLIAASVAAKDPSGWYSSFTIDKGSKDGIGEDQPVVNASRNLIGRIGRVGDNWAEVVTIIDPQASVGGMVKRSRAIGVIEGNSELRYENKCRFGYLSRDTDIVAGDYVETSGQGGIYPRGLIIGIIDEVKDDSSTMSRTATVKLCADPSKVNDVFVISGFKTVDLSDSGLTADDNKKSGSDKNSDDNSDSASANRSGGSSSSRTKNNNSSDDE